MKLPTNRGMIVEALLLVGLMTLMFTENQTISWLTWTLRLQSTWWHAVMPWVYAGAFVLLWCHLFLGLWAPSWAGWRGEKEKK